MGNDRENARYLPPIHTWYDMSFLDYDSACDREGEKTG